MAQPQMNVRGFVTSFLIIAILGGVFALVTSAAAQDDRKKPAGPVEYVCPPCEVDCHDETFSDPGVCPNASCGMTLVSQSLVRRFDLRAKGLPDAVIADAIDQGLPFRITTKYWMEQLGMPFHPTHINPQNQRDRRHGYADLLRYPKRYDVHWRVWSGGTARFLLWGDPDYVRRIVESAQIYGGNSFEVNEMLATKMLGEPHEA